MNHLIYFESEHLKNSYLKEWKAKAAIFCYDLKDRSRFYAAIASTYFDSAILIFDNANDSDFIRDVRSKNNGPLFVLANTYGFELPDSSTQEREGIFYFGLEDLSDLPGIILRVNYQNTFYRRRNARAKSRQRCEIAIDNKLFPVTIKNLSRGGAKIEFRQDPKTITQKQATLIHTLADGKQMRLPVELCWANVAGDGRLHVGMKFQKFH